MDQKKISINKAIGLLVACSFIVFLILQYEKFINPVNTEVYYNESSNIAKLEKRENNTNIEISQENPNVVSFIGGLGNQMFQYAFGQALEFKLRRKVYYDISWYDEKNHPNGKYSLDIFNNLNVSIATPELFNKTKENEVLEKKQFKYDPSLLNDRESSYYYGYFQNENYFKNITDYIRDKFKFPSIEESDTYNNEILRKIKNCESPVFMHIRRGDYLPRIGWVLPSTYYKNAINYVKKNIKNPTFFIVCENCKDFVKELNIDVPYEFIGETNANNHEDWKDIVLMKACKHAIIANSTFSWWSAYLGRPNSEGIVIAPVPWIYGGKDGIICENWIKMSINEENEEQKGNVVVN